MASIRKVGNKWRAEVRRKGKSRSARFNSKGEALAWAKTVERQILGGSVEYQKDLTFSYVCGRYEREVSLKKKGARWESIRIQKFLKSDLAEKYLIELDAKFWRKWITEQSISPASVNRELNLISAIFSQCVEWEYFDSNPIKSVKRPKSPKHRERRISAAEEQAIIERLGTDPSTSSGQVALAFILALETGMRRGEILNLKWPAIHLADKYLVVTDSKNSDSRQVPLSSRAVDVLMRLYDSKRPVFKVTPATLTALFKRACDKEGISGLTFHDSRHEAVSRLAKKIDVMSLAKIIGHRDLKSLMIYYNPTAGELAKLLD